MQSTRVKICGITRLEDAARAVELGAAALGFNFYKRSPRYIPPTVARAIIRELPPLVTSVGVFADETEATEVAKTADTAGVDAVQLHGPRFPEGMVDGRLGDYPVIRAFAVAEGFLLSSLAALSAAAWLLDGFDPVRLGGSGKTFDWKIAREAKRYGPVILAGGLTPENVRRAICEVRPFAVDVASGVESAPGIKDAEKVRAFFDAVQKAEWSQLIGEADIMDDHPAGKHA